MIDFFRNIRIYIIFTAMVFLIAVALGYTSAGMYEEEARQALAETTESLQSLKDMDSVQLFIVILLNNALKSFIVLALGFLAGIIPILFIFINGYVTGVVLLLAVLDGNGTLFFVSILPHGIIEIPAVILAAAAGIWLGNKFMQKIRYREPFGPHANEAIGFFNKIILPMLVLAALIEVFITGNISELYLSII